MKRLMQIIVCYFLLFVLFLVPLQVSFADGKNGDVKIIVSEDLASEQQTKVIPEEHKQFANEEMVKAAELGERIGSDEATALFTRIKEEVANNPNLTDVQVSALVDQIANELGIQLTEAEKQEIVDLFNKMKTMNIDWDQVKSDITYVKDRLQEFFQEERTKSIMQNIIDGLIAFLNWLKGLFA
ncbi:DUF1002 domain-containing protein [Calidifontibacillus oryziterrae]|uniref:DUF1002 domain-containing protein n=1 Tax=Calidifontibacillus oryziterrae TaxID=1191699 RepID=UPI00030E37EB|nr:DUF1002 domain-containing protein [Calidifontibacillus oryziterrae]